MAWRDLFRWGRKALGRDDILAELAARFRSRSGKAVNLKTAVGVSAVFGGCRLIGHGMAQVPFKLMRETPDGKSRSPAKDHPLYTLLASKPNPWQTSFEFREQIGWHLELCFAAYVFVNRASTGQILELIPFEPDCVKVKRAEERTLTFEVTAQSGSTMVFPESAIWYIRGPSWNGWEGINFLGAAREAIGLSLAAEDAQAALHKNGIRSPGTYSVDGKLAAPDYKQLRDWIDREMAGPENAGKPMILDRAAKWVSTTMTSVDAQVIETRKFQVEEVCRFMGILPALLGYSDKATTYGSAEQMFLAHLVHALSPRWTRLEQSADAFLLTEKELEDGLYFDFVEEGMARGSMKDTKDFILAMVNGGVMTPNEGRAKMDLNPDPDPASDKLRIPVNVAQEPKKPEGDEPEPEPA